MREKIEGNNNEKIDPQEIVKTWINKIYADDSARALRDKFLLALEENNKENIKKLADVLQNHLDYIRPKYRDTKHDQKYIQQLEDGLKYLQSLV